MHIEGSGAPKVRSGAYNDTVVPLWGVMRIDAYEISLQKFMSFFKGGPRITETLVSAIFGSTE
jgi:hypothetical protein